MSLTLLERDLLDQYPAAWLRTTQQQEVCQHLAECDCDPVQDDTREFAYRMSAQGFPERMEARY